MISKHRSKGSGTDRTAVEVTESGQQTKIQTLSVCLTVDKLAVALLCALASCPAVVSLVLRRRHYAVQSLHLA